MRSSIGMLPTPITGILWVDMPGMGPIPIPVLVYRNGWLSSVSIVMNHKYGISIGMKVQL